MSEQTIPWLLSSGIAPPLLCFLCFGKVLTQFVYIFSSLKSFVFFDLSNCLSALFHSLSTSLVSVLSRSYLSHPLCISIAFAPPFFVTLLAYLLLVRFLADDFCLSANENVVAFAFVVPALRSSHHPYHHAYHTGPVSSFPYMRLQQFESAGMEKSMTCPALQPCCRMVGVCALSVLVDFYHCLECFCLSGSP